MVASLAETDSQPVTSVALTSTRRRLWQISFAFPLFLAPISFLSWRFTAHRLGTMCGLLLIVFGLVCLITDYRWQKIYNWVTYPALIWFLLINSIASSLPVQTSVSNQTSELNLSLPPVGPPFLGAIGIGESVMGAVVFLAAASMISGIARLGGGDIKMMTVIGAALGVREAFLAMIIAYLLAGIVSLAMLLRRVGFFKLGRFSLQWIGHTLLPVSFSKPELGESEFLSQPVPVGGFLACGAVFAMGPLSYLSC
ncbi:prepilin peptidase [Planctomicrobium sp. SH668]|uniref:prepilin peptidase n=1 Tax=Planctomicrobium sp. SH668 TaxID=3448126 RepID=UPI003F5B1E16